MFQNTRARDKQKESLVFDRNIDKSIGQWNSLPKAPDQEVILLKKARGENKLNTKHP